MASKGAVGWFIFHMVLLLALIVLSYYAAFGVSDRLCTSECLLDGDIILTPYAYILTFAIATSVMWLIYLVLALTMKEDASSPDTLVTILAAVFALFMLFQALAWPVVGSAYLLLLAHNSRTHCSWAFWIIVFEVVFGYLNFLLAAAFSAGFTNARSFAKSVFSVANYKQSLSKREAAPMRFEKF